MEKSCDFKSILKMEKPEDVPYSIPEGMSKEWYFEFYARSIKIFRKYGNHDRLAVCEEKLKAL